MYSGSTGFGAQRERTEYLKSIGIGNARELGVEINSIQIIPGMYNEVGKTLANNIELWLKSEPELVKHKKAECKTEKVHGERFHKYYDTYYFSKFKLTCSSTDGQTTRMDFKKLSEDEAAEYFDGYDHVVNDKTPNLLQITFGVLKKYPSLNINIDWFIP